MKLTKKFWKERRVGKGGKKYSRRVNESQKPLEK
jgi:hypothetical protein